MQRTIRVEGPQDAWTILEILALPHWLEWEVVDTIGEAQIMRPKNTEVPCVIIRRDRVINYYSQMDSITILINNIKEP